MKYHKPTLVDYGSIAGHTFGSTSSGGLNVDVDAVNENSINVSDNVRDILTNEG